MSETPPFLPHRRPDWWGRNWKWFAPLLGVASLGAIAGFVIAVMSLMKSSDAYQGALARIKADPRAIEALGSPIQEGFLLTGNIAVKNSSGSANLNIPVSGPKGSGTLCVLATKSLGEWHFDRLVLQTNSNNTRIELPTTLARPN